MSMPGIKEEKKLRRRRWRYIKDGLARYGVAFGGISVIIAIVLIFFYLLNVVYPLFISAKAEKVASYEAYGNTSEKTVYLAMEEQAEIAVRFTVNGTVAFFDTKTGKEISNYSIELPEGTELSSFSAANPSTGVVAYGLTNGTAIVARHIYQVSYPNDVRTITPKVKFPLGEDPLEIDFRGNAINKIAIQDNDEGVSFAAITGDNRLILTYFAKEESLFDDEASLEKSQILIEQSVDARYLLVDKEQRNLYLSDKNGRLSHYDISDKESPELVQQINIVEAGSQLTSLRFLTGDISLLVGDSRGRISQWFSVRNQHNQPELTRIRQFKLGNVAVQGIAPEYSRKGFVAIDSGGQFGIYNTTAERLLLNEQVSSVGLSHIAIAPRANAMMIEDGEGQLHFWSIENEHPEVSWSALWEKVWYESYREPDYIWQSSSSSDDFEPKLSLTPLVFGTLKAAFYAMLIAIPLALLGAIYTAYFMAPRSRGFVKPSIEVMEALPTVILGFLAGLWLAPFIEVNLPGVFSLLLVMPTGILLFAFAWQQLPGRIRHLIPDGWDAALLIPVVLLLGYLSIASSQPLEKLFFDGDMRSWLSNTLGVGFDQRNAIVVGIAMGFAVIPTIFSIAEDAIFSVPKHLSFGSLALGATPWQTLVKVVLLTASPGIFSAVMIGTGRAVGETMIVLMATGNTPLMDLSIFQGMRTLSANIAVEMPESEVASTHYRVLFLAALVLFMFTFLFNTVAEIVRQRLRKKYSSL